VTRKGQSHGGKVWR